MENTFFTGEYIFTSKVTYKFRPMHRGDVVVVRSPKNPDIEYIKRIVGLPGDKLLFQNSEVFLNGAKLEETYIPAKTPLWDGGYAKEGLEITVPEDNIFILGDNREKSSDSREFGPVPISSMIGHVFYRYFPATRVGWINNPIPKSLQTK